MRKRVWGVLIASLAIGGPAWAQKNSGPLLPTEPYTPRPAVPRYVPPPPMTAPPSVSLPPIAPSYSRPPPAPLAAQGRNPAVEQLAQSLPLDPGTREMHDQVPPNPRAMERQLGLREAQGPVRDLRGRLASTREIIDALRPR